MITVLMSAISVGTQLDRIIKKARSLSVLNYGNNHAYIDEIIRRKSERAVAESLVGLILLDRLLSSACYTNEVLTRGENGRPCLHRQCLYRNLPVPDFNISHTKNTVVCAIDVSKEPRVGIDAEKIAHKDAEKLIERFFCENEKKYFYSASDYGLAFAELWTRKEAYLKFTGAGIGESFSQSDVTNLPDLQFSSKIFGTDLVTVCAKTNIVTFSATELSDII